MSKLPIILDENWRLEPDGYQWTLKYEAKRVETDPDTLVDKIVTSSDQWYHGELRLALRAYCDKVLKPEPTVVALLAAVEALVVKIDTLFASKQIPVEADPKKRKGGSLTVDMKVLNDLSAVEREAFKRSFSTHNLIIADPIFEYPLTPDDAFNSACRDTELYKIIDPLEDLY